MSKLNINKTHLLISFFLTIIILSTSTTTTTTEVVVLKRKPSKSIYQALESEGLPMGLFPKGVTNFTITQEGKFEVYLDEACDAKFESELHYEKYVFGQLSFGQIGNLSGISAQDLFLWFPVKGIRVDVPSSGVIYFDVGVVRKQFSLSLFETPRECVAATHPLLNIFHRFSQKLGVVLRYGIELWKNEVEFM